MRRGATATIGLLVLLAACTPARRVPAHHPASATAPTGRLAGPPAALRAGVADDVPAPTADAPPAHDHSHHP
jgi:hypothetical protein